MNKHKKPKKQDLDKNLLSQINTNAAGIDIGADRYWVSVPMRRDVYCISVASLTGEIWD